jgi:cobalt-zinc-cadmium efflux system protein
VPGDLLGVIAVAALIAATGWWWADPVVAVAIGVLILPRTWRLGRTARRRAPAARWSGDEHTPV